MADQKGFGSQKDFDSERVLSSLTGNQMGFGSSLEQGSWKAMLMAVGSSLVSNSRMESLKEIPHKGQIHRLSCKFQKVPKDSDLRKELH